MADARAVVEAPNKPLWPTRAAQPIRQAGAGGKRPARLSAGVRCLRSVGLVSTPTQMEADDERAEHSDGHRSTLGCIR